MRCVWWVVRGSHLQAVLPKEQSAGCANSCTPTPMAHARVHAKSNTHHNSALPFCRCAFGSGGDSASQPELEPCGPLSSRKSGWLRICEKSTRPARPRRPRTWRSISLVPIIRKCSAGCPSFHGPPNSCFSTLWSTRPRVSFSPSSLPALTSSSAAPTLGCERQCRTRKRPVCSRRRARSSSTRMICSALRLAYTRRTSPPALRSSSAGPRHSVMPTPKQTMPARFESRRQSSARISGT
mmetsp:Transcript_27703/g.81060  ORF Transcript_27703/g.81060 Transcript_27703/m.81060 type:complete len:239 (+) Transcript_27703:158-874(+)